MKKMLVLFLIVAQVNSICAGYFLRNIDRVDVALDIENQDGSMFLRNYILAPNAEIFLSLYYLRVAEADALKVYFSSAQHKVKPEEKHMISLSIDYDNPKELVHNIHGIENYQFCDISTLYKLAKRMRTMWPDKLPIKKDISGYFVRNIDDVALLVKFHDPITGKDLKNMYLEKNGEVFIEPKYLKKNAINSIDLTVSYWAKELYTVRIASPTKERPYEKVYNILRATNGFFSKHLKNNESDTETVAVNRQKGINFEGFYKCTLLYQQRQESESFTQLTQPEQQLLFAYQSESEK